MFVAQHGLSLMSFRTFTFHHFPGSTCQLRYKQTVGRAIRFGDVKQGLGRGLGFGWRLSRQQQLACRQFSTHSGVRLGFDWHSAAAIRLGRRHPCVSDA